MSSAERRAQSFIDAAKPVRAHLTAAQLRVVDSLAQKSIKPSELQRRLKSARGAVEGALKSEIASHRAVLTKFKNEVFCRTCPSTKKTPKKKITARKSSERRRSKSKRSRSRSKSKRSRSRSRSKSKRSRSRSKSKRSRSRSKSKGSRSKSKGKSKFEKRIHAAQVISSNTNSPSSIAAAVKRKNMLKQIQAIRKSRSSSKSASPKRTSKGMSKTPKQPPPFANLKQFSPRQKLPKALSRKSKSPVQNLFAAINKGQFNLKPVNYGVQGKPAKKKKSSSGTAEALAKAMANRAQYMRSPSRSRSISAPSTSWD